MKKLMSVKLSLVATLGAGAVIALTSLSACSDDYDLDEKLPPGFGATLYSYLDDNDYADFTRLVQELGYEEALSGRSTKTMFVANDEAFARFYAHNRWGVHNYDELSLAQKKLLLYSAMVDNSLQIMSLSSTTGASGPVKGNCMRRSTAVSVYDTVPIISPAEMPAGNPAWAYYKDAGRSIVCMKDMSTAPIMFFVEEFLAQNRITNEDVNFLFNGTISRQSGDAGINGIHVAEQNIRCANGFIHRLDDVLMPLDNMAEIIRTCPATTIYSSFLERFSAPYYVGREATANYNYEYGTNVDSVFQKRYYSQRSEGGAVTTMPDGTAVEASLRFDPGWNSLYSDDPSVTSTTVAMQKNMGVMLVPTDAAFADYWANGAGRVLRDYYGSWDSIPDAVIVKLLNNNMLNSFVNSVPSKFDGIVNSTQDKMGIEPTDVDSVILGCNGAVYLTNKVFSPTEYVSVLFPALVNETMNIFYWAVEQLQYGSYLNSLDARYSLFIPTNDAMLHYVDPVSYGQTKTQVYRFHYKRNTEDERQKVWASIFEYDIETGTVGDSIGELTDYNAITNRLEDLLDNHIVIGDIENGKHYYKTKNGGVVRVSGGSTITSVQGTYQMDLDRTIPVIEVYDQTADGNGKSYILRDEPLMTTRRSVFDVLEDHEEFSVFFELLHGSELYETSRNGNTCGSPNGNIASFNNYHYTVYVPTNESLNALIASGDLPTWESIALMEEDPNIPEEEIESKKELINEFVRYHIQDNALFIDMDYTTDGGSDTFTRAYETSIMNTTTNKFYTISASMTPTSLTLTDVLGHTRKVITEGPNALYNLTAREYQISWTTIATSAFAVIHQIDGPLFFKESQCRHYNQ